MKIKMSAPIGLFIAVLAVSWASIFIRWCGDVSPLVIAFYRMLWSALLMGVWAFLSPHQTFSPGQLTRRDRYLIFISGTLLALHFATWIASLQYTTVSHSLILESTHPVFALLFSPLILKERPRPIDILAVALTLVGILIIGGQDLGFRPQQFLGDLLAIASAFFVTFYIFIARLLRQKIQLIPYLALVYGQAALVLLVTNLLLENPLIQYPGKIHLLFLLLALIPTGIGHSLINWAARKVTAYKVNLTILGEPLLASLLAYLIFGEKPYGLFYVGAIFIVAGILLALSPRSQQS